MTLNKKLKTLPYDKLEKLLEGVEKPGRYIGHEFGCKSKSLKYLKDNNNIALSALVFPDVYEVGMSNLGLQILYDIINSSLLNSAERVFSPWSDFEQKLADEKIRLFSLENRIFLECFDLIGFNSAHEMLSTNILNIISLSGLDIVSERRFSLFPLVCSGGSSTYNPWPLSKFMDFLVIGDGEEAVTEILDIIRDFKRRLNEMNVSESGSDGGHTADIRKLKRSLLREISVVDGVFVPEFYKIIYNSNCTIKRFEVTEKGVKSLPVKKASIGSLDSFAPVISPVIPNIRTVHDRLNIEIMRGCSRGCAFCQAGFTYRPVRQRNVNDLIEQSKNGLKQTGYEEISFTSLSSTDYKKLPVLLDAITSQPDFEKISVSLPSVRLDSFNKEIMEKIMSGRKTGLTFAPEAGSQRLRDMIKKDLTDEDLFESLGIAFSKGWAKIKLYFMTGLPAETDDDILSIASLLNKIITKARSELSKKDFFRFQVSVSINAFCPKPFTPMQRQAQDSLKNIRRKIELINASVPKRFVKLHWTSPEKSIIECALSRGDSRVSDVIELVFKKGAKFDNWTDFFNYGKWLGSFNELGIDPGFYTERQYDRNEILPWDVIDIGFKEKLT